MSPAANPFGRSRARGVLGRACLVVLLTAQALVLTSVAQGSPAQAAVVESASDITFVTANLRSPQTATRFQQDAAEVFAQDPDLIAYNEVSFRKEVFLAPQGYELWRADGRYEGHNPVAWRTSAWRDVDHGTRLISNYRKKPPGKQTLLGLRYANWVSLKSVDGRRLSIVAVHVAPRFRDEQGDWVDLLRPSVRRLSLLVQELSSRGPVLVGGDFNVPYNGPRYPRDLLTQARLRPTYDLLGTSFPTGDHHGGTIDYVFVRSKGKLEADWHRPVELNSDHDAVVAGLSWTTEAPNPEVTTTLRSQPDGTAEERRAVARALTQHLASTAAGETVQVATRGLSLPIADRALRRAEARGVRVRVTTLSRRLTWRERRLLRTLDTNGSWLRRCQGECRTGWQQAQPPSLLLVTGADGDGKVRIDVSRGLSRYVVTRRTSARITTVTSEMDEARAAFAGL
ncbi:MAG: endonuclease/exonuclease/phosphatase family protein [Nocardioides sp.]